MDCHFLFQGIFLTLGLNLQLLFWQACSLPAKWSEKPIKLLIHLNHCQSISRMPKVYSTLMGLLCYFSVLSHQELFTQVFKNVNIWNFNSDLNSVETTLSWRIDRKLWTRRSGCRGIKLPTGTVRRKRMLWRVYFESLADFYSHDLQKFSRGKNFQLDKLGYHLSQTHLSFQMFAEPCMKTSPYAVIGKTSSHKAFFSRWILAENWPCPESLEVDALGSKWQKGIKQKVLSIT